MYKVVITYNNTETTIHEPSLSLKDPHLPYCTVTEGESSEIESCTFEVYPNNPGYDQIHPRKTFICIQDLDQDPVKSIFNGRVITVTPEMTADGLFFKSVVCESRKGYLCDSVQPYVAEKTYYGDSERNGLEEFIDEVLSNHNSQVEDYKKIYRGTVTVIPNSTGNVTKALNYETTYEIIVNKLIASFGGEIQVYEGTDGRLYLDYVAELGEISDVKIELGRNMVSVAREMDPSDVITRLIPLGAEQTDEDGNSNGKLTISDVNEGKIYIDNEDAISLYGIVVGTMEWDDVTVASNLLSKANEWMDNQTSPESITLSALDLSRIGLDNEQIKRFNYYKVTNDYVGMNAYLRVVKTTLDIVNPTEFTIEMGTLNKSMSAALSETSSTGTKAATDTSALIAQLQSVIKSLTVAKASIYELEATSITAERLVVEIAKLGYLTVEQADIKYAAIENLEAYLATLGYLKVFDAELTYATIEQANILQANITTVTGDLADYKVVIAGQFTAYDADIASLRVKDTEIENALIGKASVTDLEALRTRTTILESDYSELDTLVNGNLTSDNIQSLVIAGEKFTIADGFIKNAMIESMTFDKITGIDINTTNLTVHSEDGKSTWSDNTIQISDANRVRVQMGKDASGDYTLAVWDATGKLIWDALGATENTIQRKIIRDAVVADDANISGSKLNITSVVQEINSGTTKLKSTTILLDEAGQTLDVAFNTMTTTIVNNLAEAKTYADGKADTALSDAKSYADGKASTTLTSAQQYALNQANSALASAKTYADSAVDGIEIGGRNLFNYASSGGNTSVSADRDTVYINGFTSDTYFGLSLFEDFKEGQQYTLSCDVSGFESNDVAWKFPMFSQANPTGKSITLTNGKCICTFICPAAYASQKRLFLDDLGGRPSTQTAQVTIENIKIEKGNKATDWSPAIEDTEAEITNLTEITTTQSTQISTMQGQITALITEDTNIKGDYNALVSRYNATVAEVDSMKVTIGEHTTLIDANSDDIIAVNARATTIETDLTGIKTRVSANETAIAKKADGTTVDALTTRVATAESTLNGFEASLTVTNQTISDNYTELKNYTDSAKASAIATAASDATTKANNALASAKTYADDSIELATKVEAITGTVKIFRNVCGYKGGNNTKGALIIITPIVPNRMVSMHITGYNYTTNNETIDLTIGFYNFDSSSIFYNYGYVNNGSYDPGMVRIARFSETDTRAVVIIGTETTTWQYPSIVVDEVNISQTGSPDSYKDGFSATITAEIPDTYYKVTTLKGSYFKGQIATHTETLSSHDTRITANETAIAPKVSTTDFNSYKTTVTGQISTAKNEAISTAASDATTKANNAKSAAISTAASDATTKANNALSSAKSDATTKANNALASAKSYTDAEITVVNESLTTTNQEISVMKGQIALKVEQTDINTAIANVAIGGRNLLLESDTPNRAASSTGYPAGIYPIVQDVLTVGEKYTWTVNGVFTGATKVAVYFGGGTYGTNWMPINGDGSHTISCTFTATQNMVNNDVNARFYFRDSQDTTSFKGTSVINWVKLEKGTKATDWTPAPEDVNSSITAVNNKFSSYSTTTQMNSAITAAKDAINLSVSQTYATKNNVTGLESRLSTAEGNISTQATAIALCVKESDVTGNYLIGKINLSSTTATIAAKYINLAGAVTISMLASDTKTQLDTAVGNAATALDNAATAQSTANTAKTNASTALGYAQYHYGTCSTAAATVAKVVTLSGFKLYTGAKISIKFTYTNTAARPTLNVNSTGAKYIRANGVDLSGTSKYNWRAGSLANFIYDGTYWVMEESTANYLWSSSSDVTKIDGGYIQTGTVDANVLKANTTITNKLYATDLHVSGNSTFEGVLNGATGTFSGQLSAATGTFAGNVNASGIMFSGTDNYLQAEENIWLACGGREAQQDVYMDYNAVSTMGLSYASIVGQDGLRIMGNVISSQNDVNFLAQHTSNGTAIGFGVGAGGVNRGLYDYEKNEWMVYRGSGGNTLIDGVALTTITDSGYFHKIGRWVFVAASNVEATEFGGTLGTTGKPRHATVLSGYCHNKSNNANYPLQIIIEASGAFRMFSYSSFGATSRYVIYDAVNAPGTDRRSNFTLYFSGCYISAS